MRALKISTTITPRDEKSLERYLTEIGQYDVLTPEQEQQIFIRIKAGDEAAFMTIVLSNLRFVVSVAKQYQHTGLSLSDLINEGNIGLMKAAKRFDETRGFKFISYAVWWIRQSILQAVSEKMRKVRLPHNHQSSTREVLRSRSRLQQILERDPTNDEIAEDAGLTEKVVFHCLQSYRRSQSLDAPVSEGEDSTHMQFMENEIYDAPDHGLAYKESLKIETKNLLKSLPHRQAEVIAMLFGIGEENKVYSLNEVGDRLGLSRERVRQIKERALKKLRILSRDRQGSFAFSRN
jgi:RNA polymerase primary sigma factor